MNEDDEAEDPVLDLEGLHHLLVRVQDGVISRRQVFELGGSDHDIDRMLRRRELTRLHRGVFVNHTGAPTWEQRAWGAVLVHWPAVLTRESALPSPSATASIQVAIDVRRSVRPVPGVIAHRAARLDARAQWQKSPPRMRVEHAVLDVVDRIPEVGRAFQRLASICQTRRTGPQQIRAALHTRRGLQHRDLLLELLADLAAGACSVLEREYLLRVERAHGLPEGGRQIEASADGSTIYRDVKYAAQALVVELDGLAYHDNPVARDQDADRDLDAAVDSQLQTVRLTYRQVLDRSCRTARQVGTILQRRGWDGEVLACPSCLDS